MSQPVTILKGYRSHPLEVTSDRIGNHMFKYGDRLTGSERDTLSMARHILEKLMVPHD